MPANQPFVSVITPRYNGAEFIGECIESVLKQSCRSKVEARGTSLT
jgi:glycosyltransferase involved in cell wall biosynthesis